jgi:hypothetical protein
MKFKVTAKLEISDHSGYCSGEECEYNSSINTYTVNVPEDEYNENYDFIKLLPIPFINDYGSYYCTTSNECIENDLGIHQYRYTVIKVVKL